MTAAGIEADAANRAIAGGDRFLAHAHRRAGVPAQQPGVRVAPLGRLVAWLSHHAGRGVRLFVHVAAHRGGADDRHRPGPVRAAGAVRCVLAADRPGEPALALFRRRCRRGRGRTGAGRAECSPRSIAPTGPTRVRWSRACPAAGGTTSDGYRCIRADPVAAARVFLETADRAAEVVTAALRGFRLPPSEGGLLRRASGNPVAAPGHPGVDRPIRGAVRGHVRHHRLPVQRRPAVRSWKSPSDRAC